VKWLLLLLLACTCGAQHFGLLDAVTVAKPPSTAAAPAAYLVVQNFESVTNQWTESAATINQQFATNNMEGSQSCLLPYGNFAYAHTNVTGADEYYGFFMVRFLDTGNYSYAEIGVIGVADMATIGNYGTSWRVSHGTVSTTGGTITDGALYYVWWHWVKSTGTDGVLELWVSSNTTKPGSTTLSIANGNGASQPDICSVQAANNTAVFDKFRVSASVIGSNPD